MSELTDYLETQIGAHLLRTASWTKPSGIYAGLMTAITDGETESITEVTGGSYARVQVGPSDAAWSYDGAKTFSNAGAVTFPAPTANWSTATHFGLFDASSGGNLLAYSPLDASRVINNGDNAPNFAAGALSLVFGGGVTNYGAQQIGTHLLRTGSWTKPTALYAALKISGTEVSGGSYARVQRDPADANWSGPSGGDGNHANLAAITFPAPTADWGTVDSASLYDASSAGNEYINSALSSSLNVVNGGAAPNFPTGDFDISIS